MQAFFSSFSSNLPCFVENQKMLGNGGFKQFSGTFPCALLLRIGEISIFSLYNANLFWRFCLPAQKPLSSFVHCMENIYHFFTFCCNTCPMRIIFSFFLQDAASLFSVFFCSCFYEKTLWPGKRFPFTGLSSSCGKPRPWSPRALPVYLPHKALPSSPTALVDRHRPCSSQYA